MTHKPIPKEVREHCGIVDGLIRISVGIEEVEDLIADLDSVLPRVQSKRELVSSTAD
jgi:cystathionine beta-lyase/cystathionine gamma-synthase